MTTWIRPADALAERIAMAPVPLPVRDDTMSVLSEGEHERYVPALIAVDVADWLAAGNGSQVQRRVLARWVAALAYVAGYDLLDHHQPHLAAEMLSLAVRHAPDDASLRALLGVARWSCGHRVDATGQLALAVDQYADAGQVAPLVTVLLARILIAAGRHDDALHILQPLIDTDPHNAVFWDLVDAAGGARG
jgi:predicted Zn-dependent protease